MPPVYSTRFIATGGDPIPPAEYTVPAGYIAIVRDVTVFIDDSDGGNVSVSIGPNEQWLGVYQVPAGQNLVESQSMRQVLYPGEVLAVQRTTGSLGSVLVSGYLLSE